MPASEYYAKSEFYVEWGFCICVYLLTINYTISYADLLYVIHLLGGLLINFACWICAETPTRQQRRIRISWRLLIHILCCVPSTDLARAYPPETVDFKETGIACDICHSLTVLFDLIKSGELNIYLFRTERICTSK